jgi:hypothetical protein
MKQEKKRPARSTTRESRGPETSRYLEDDTFSIRRPPADKNARRDRKNTPVNDEFDDDLIR